MYIYICITYIIYIYMILIHIYIYYILYIIYYIMFYVLCIMYYIYYILYITYYILHIILYIIYYISYYICYIILFFILHYVYIYKNIYIYINIYIYNICIQFYWRKKKQNKQPGATCTLDSAASVPTTNIFPGPPHPGAPNSGERPPCMHRILSSMTSECCGLCPELRTRSKMVEL